MTDKTGLRKIDKLDLGAFRKPDIPGNPGVLVRSLWYLVNAVFFQSAILGLLPNPAKSWLLRSFGARVGSGFVCKPKVNIKYPWFLSVGNNVWFGESVWIDNLCSVAIGDDVCISQGTIILTGSHDWHQPDFPFFARPVVVGDGVWITAFRVIRPGVTVPSNVAVLADLSAGAAKHLNED